MPGHLNINKQNNLAQQSYWDSSYSQYQFKTAGTEDEIRTWILENFSPVSGKTCFEIGCFPGRYLSVFGELGYELNGVDLTPRVTKDFPKWLKDSGFKTGQFFEKDIFSFKTTRKFDLVCSFGFIEHFKNWKEVLKIQADLVDINGFIVLETPNFRGIFQKLIHLIFDHENYKRHYIPAMNPRKWKKILAKNNFQIINYGYLGGFDFWVDHVPATFFKKKLYYLIAKIRSKQTGKNLKGRLSYSPYCILIAKKIN